MSAKARARRAELTAQGITVERHGKRLNHRADGSKLRIKNNRARKAALAKIGLPVVAADRPAGAV